MLTAHHSPREIGCAARAGRGLDPCPVLSRPSYSYPDGWGFLPAAVLNALRRDGMTLLIVDQMAGLTSKV